MTCCICFLSGLKINKKTLGYIRLGYNWSKIDTNEVHSDPDSFNSLEYNQSNVSTGFSYGLGIESAFSNDFSLRAEYTHTNYSSFDTNAGTEIVPSNNQFMLSLIHHII